MSKSNIHLLNNSNFNEFREKLGFKNKNTTFINFEKLKDKDQIIIKTEGNQKKIIGKLLLEFRKISLGHVPSVLSPQKKMLVI